MDGAVEELSSGEELEDEDSFESIEGAFMVYLTPDEFTWRETLQRPPTLNIKRTGSVNEDIEGIAWKLTRDLTAGFEISL